MSLSSPSKICIICFGYDDGKKKEEKKAFVQSGELSEGLRSEGLLAHGSRGNILKCSGAPETETRSRDRKSTRLNSSHL